MKKRVSLFLGIFAVVALVMSIVSAAAIYKPDNDGLYAVTFESESEGEYFMVVLKGEYDQTNYIEAYHTAEDDDILYVEHKISGSGNVTFGPFAPKGYFNATVIVGGTNLVEPVIAGYLSAEGVSNTASIKLTGVDNLYTVKGVDYEDYMVEITSEVFDSFGYPSLTDEEVNFSLSGNDAGVSLEGNVLTISKVAKAQHFSVVAKAGTATKTVYVEVKREASEAKRIEIYSDNSFATVVDKYSVKGTRENIPYVTVFAKTLDQYNEALEDTYTYLYNGNSVSATFQPKFGDVTLKISGVDYAVERDVVISAFMTPYFGAALELEELIETCRSRLAEKDNVSTNGKDVFPEDTWTTQASVDTFYEAIQNAESELLAFDSENYNDDYYVSCIATLQSALDSYNASFKAGIRKDITSISLKAEKTEFLPGNSISLTITADPFDNNDEIIVESSDESVVTIESYYGNSIVAVAEASGHAAITATTRSGLKASVDITVIRRATFVDIILSSDTAVFGGEKVVAKVEMSPKNSTDVIELKYDENIIKLEPLREYVDSNNRYFEYLVAISPESAGGVCDIEVTAKYSGKKSSESITVQMPDWKTAEAPVANIESGSVVSGTMVTLSSASPDAKIYYTLNGEPPTKENGRPYNGPITINQSVILKAFATGDTLYDSEVVEYEYKVVDTKISVSSAIAKPGEIVYIYISNSGFADVEWADVEIEFDSSVINCERVSFENDDITSAVKTSDGRVTISYSNRVGTIPDGNLIELGFVVSKDAPEGDYEIKIISAYAKVSDKTVGNGGKFEPATSNGKITVNNYVLGDVNDDGRINLADVILTKQYVEGMEAAKNKILLPAADVNRDGTVDGEDVLLLSKYCVGWNVEF